MEAGRDLKLFSEFVRSSGTDLRRTAFLLTRDWHLAEDLVQSSLIRTFERRHRVRDPAVWLHYTRKVMVSVFLSGRRLKSAGEVPVRSVTDRPTPDATAGIADATVMSSALATLSRMQRAVLVLRYYGDASEADIADILGCSTGSVKTHASRGLATLRAILVTHDAGDDDGHSVAPVSRPTDDRLGSTQ